MRYRPNTDPVEYLLEREFPAYRSVMLAHAQPISRHTRPVSAGTREWRALMQAKIEERRKELEALSVAERTRLVETARAKELEEWKQKAEQEERARFFNQPHARADLDHWGKMAYWSLDEGIALSFGREPRVVTWKSVEPLVQVSPFAKQFADRREIAIRAAVVNEIAQSNIPGAFIAWAKRIGWSFPPELESKVAERGPIADWRSMYEQERTVHAATIQRANARIAELEEALAKAKDAASHRWPWGTYETELLRKLAATAQQFWLNYDPSDPSTAVNNDTIVAWLQQKDVSNRIAKAIATILRADGLPTGPR